MGLRLYNTASRRTEEFTPEVAGAVRMFVCGPTVYDLSHLGHAKTYVQFDFVARYLQFSGFDVTYVQNITDVDDKIINRARAAGVPPRELAQRFEEAYLEDMAALRVTTVGHYARAHDFIEQVIEQVQKLIARGHVYQIDDGWYFDLSTFPRYGQLSRRTAGTGELARVRGNQSKRQDGDFVVWKAHTGDEPYWDSPLGPGRPGWHIEDTAITETVFGPRYDLHGGGADLMFPHHEAEIAQMESISGVRPLARHWMHSGLLRTNGKKMAKSEGQSVTIRDALRDNDYRTLRYAFLSRHYRSTIDLTAHELTGARSARRRIESFARSVTLQRDAEGLSTRMAERTRAQIFGRLDDDLDTPGALAALFELVRTHRREGIIPGPAARALLNEVNGLFDTFDLGGSPSDQADSTRQALDRRTRLRAEGRFDEADAIRTDLARRGVLLEDTPGGTRWWVLDEGAADDPTDGR